MSDPQVRARRGIEGGNVRDDRPHAAAHAEAAARRAEGLAIDGADTAGLRREGLYGRSDDRAVSIFRHLRMMRSRLRLRHGPWMWAVVRGGRQRREQHQRREGGENPKQLAQCRRIQRGYS